MSIFTDLIDEGRSTVNQLLDTSDNILPPSRLKISQRIDRVNSQSDTLKKKIPKGFFKNLKDKMIYDKDDVDREEISKKLEISVNQLKCCAICKCSRCMVIDEHCDCSNCTGKCYVVECDGHNQVRKCADTLHINGKTLKEDDEYESTI